MMIWNLRDAEVALKPARVMTSFPIPASRRYIMVSYSKFRICLTLAESQIWGGKVKDMYDVTNEVELRKS